MEEWMTHEIGIALLSIMASVVTYLVIRRIKKHPDNRIRYGDEIRLLHVMTGYFLHSHDINYGHPNSSRQQQVTAYDQRDENDYWTVKGPHGKSESYRNGKAVKNGHIIRLQHSNTAKNLHSHSDVPSPVTGHQEVTAYGTNGIGNDKDNWKVQLQKGRTWHPRMHLRFVHIDAQVELSRGRTLKVGSRLRLIHVDTGKALHSHAGKYLTGFTENQQEVTCFGGRDENDFWEIAKPS